MSPATPLPAPSPHDRLIAAARNWLQRSWARSFANIELSFSDESVVALSMRSSLLRIPPDGHALTGQPMDQVLFAAARACGGEVRSECPTFIRINATDGCHATLTVPTGPPLGFGDAIPDPPPFDGPDEPPGPAWVVGDVEASYRGRRFAIRGKRQKLLKAFAQRPGEEIPNGDLKLATWNDRHHDDPQFRALVVRLRSLLAAELGVTGETILACGGAHRLLLT